MQNAGLDHDSESEFSPPPSDLKGSSDDFLDSNSETEVTSKKAVLIERYNQLREKVGPTISISVDNGGVIGDQYKLLPVDLRDLKKLDDVITSANMDPRCVRLTSIQMN